MCGVEWGWGEGSVGLHPWAKKKGRGQREGKNILICGGGKKKGMGEKKDSKPNRRFGRKLLEKKHEHISVPEKYYKMFFEKFSICITALSKGNECAV